MSLIFKAESLKRAEDDVHFVFDEGGLVADLVQRAIETGERKDLKVHAYALVPIKFGADPVAFFELTLSRKLRYSDRCGRSGWGVYHSSDRRG